MQTCLAPALLRTTVQLASTQGLKLLQLDLHGVASLKDRGVQSLDRVCEGRQRATEALQLLFTVLQGQ
jgi:hypothetical protein